MKMRKIQVSNEYLDSLCDWLLEWVKMEDSLTIPQFLKWKGIGYPYMKYFCYISDRVNNTFEVVRAILHTRWLHMAMTQDNLPKHRANVLMRYIKYYDSHCMDIEQSIKEAEAEAKAITEMRITAENYARAELESPFSDFYEDNADKRRGGKEAK